MAITKITNTLRIENGSDSGVAEVVFTYPDTPEAALAILENILLGQLHDVTKSAVAALETNTAERKTQEAKVAADKAAAELKAKEAEAPVTPAPAA